MTAASSGHDAGSSISTSRPERWADPADGELSAPGWPELTASRPDPPPVSPSGSGANGGRPNPKPMIHLQQPNFLDRIAAFTDEMTEMLGFYRSPPESIEKTPDNAGGDTTHSCEADFLNLFADCEKVLRAVAAIPA